ncbi:L-threonylcarbamoyladenylate synthase [Candidatus Bathyarchaeota archaeon]|nr:L-threonylcarbamoyladenylate synthase [Candidatus Bathyarchaeota archaeon]
MKTLVLSVNAQELDMRKIRFAAELIKKGGLVAFPTETVYGLGADALNPDAVLSVFEAKKRPLDNPPIVHVCKVSDVRRLVKEVPSKAKGLMKRFWPGPLTLILKHSTIVPEVTVACLDTIALRMPSHKVALALIKESGCPIAAPSANLAGKPSPTSARHVLDDLDGRIDAILDAGPTRIGIESTVLDLTVDPPQILRPGGTLYEALAESLGRVILNPAAVADKMLPITQTSSPGVKHRHYAPNADMFLVEGKADAVMCKIDELISFYKSKGKKVGVLTTDETKTHDGSGIVKSLGSRNDLAVIANNLFRLLREFDNEDVDVIIAEGVSDSGIGLAVMNRLRKAAAYKIIKAS